MQVALNGSEPILAQTLERFTEKFGPCGFTINKFYTCYGLAEATLILSGGTRGIPPTFRAVSRDSKQPEDEEIGGAGYRPTERLVGCGKSLLEGEIKIVDPETQRICPTLQVGEIWARGPGVCRGYYAQPER